MDLGRRVVALASAASVVGSLSTGLAFGSNTVLASSGSGVTFSSQPGVAPVVAHYEVSPTSHEESSASNEESRPVALRPKQGGKNAITRVAQTDLSAGAKSDNTIAEPAQPSPSAEAGPKDGSGDGSHGTSQIASFIGQQSSATTCSYFGPGCNPPDMAVAASPEFVFQGVNSQFEVLDPSGNVQPGWPVSAQAFFGIPNVTNPDETPCDVAHQSQPFISDPRALYDPVDRRFWAASLQLENAIGIAPDCPFKTVYFVAVSQTSDPSGSWNVYEFDMSLGQPFVADFTQLGLNGQAVYFSANMFAQDGSFFAYAELFEANKAKMERGQGSFTADGFFNMQANGPGAPAPNGSFLADTVQPALNLDGSAGGAEVFVDTFDGPDPVTGNNCTSAALSCKGLALWKLTNPVGHDHGGSAPVLTGTYVPNIKPYVFSPTGSVPAADQPSCKKCIDSSDLRISGTPVVKNGKVYAAWESAINNGTQVVPGIEWAQIRIANAGSQNSAESGYYNFSGDTAAMYPALMPEPNGNLLMVFDISSKKVFPQTRYVIREGGHGNFTGQGVLLKAGEFSYRPSLCGSPQLPPLPPTFTCRWGDFSAASFDGANGVWFAGQYANEYNPGPPQNGRNWGTWIGAVNASGGGD